MSKKTPLEFLSLGSSGLTVTELIVGLAMSAVVALGGSSFISYGFDQYYLLLNENAAEQSLLTSAFYLKSFLSQAINTHCIGGPGAPTAIPAGPVTLATGVGTPPTVPQGVVDCRPGAAQVWTAGQSNAVAIFNRENGGISAVAAAGGAVVDSVYQGVAIYFTPPTGSTEGTVSFAQGTGTTVTDSAGTVDVGNIVNIQVVAGSQISSAANLNLESLNYAITVRYFLSSVGVKSYLVTPPADAALHKDLDMVVSIGLHDNSLGSNIAGRTTSERLNGGIYYFRFAAPLAVSL